MTRRASGQDAPSDLRADLELTGELPAESFKLLLRASVYARSTKQSVWEFATSLGTLLAAGLSECDVRWLTVKGYLDHAIEVASASGERIFECAPRPHFTDRSTFILTPHGIRFVECLLQTEGALRLAPSGRPLARTAAAGARRQIPLWDGQRRELRIGEILVKRFSVPAENQEIILSSFQEEAWPPHLDDPLPPAPGLDVKRRLHSTIQCLNRNQRAPLLRFHGDGYGRGVRWEYLLPAAG